MIRHLPSLSFFCSSVYFYTCDQTTLQILGVTEKAEKDEIVKAAMELKNTGIEDGYSPEVSTCRQVTDWVMEQYGRI